MREKSLPIANYPQSRDNGFLDHLYKLNEEIRFRLTVTWYILLYRLREALIVTVSGMCGEQLQC